MNAVSNGADGAAAAAVGGTAGIVILVFIILALGLLLALHFLPGIIASVRHHPQALPIWVLNTLLGWTVIGWIGALVWSLTTSQRVVAVPMAMPAQPMAAPPHSMASTSVNPGASALADEIAALSRLRDQGVLTEAEFTARKRLLLGEEAPAAAAPPAPGPFPPGVA